MQAAIISNTSEASAVRFANKTAIVVDVLRASSTIITALSAGASNITPVETVIEARSMQQNGDLLGGDRFCRKIPGFELGISPSEYTNCAIAGQRIILTTTNGTRAIYKSMRAEHLLVGALLNAAACAQAAIELRKDIIIVCAGAHDEFAIEDGLGAGLILHRLTELYQGDLELDDLGWAMVALYRDRAKHLRETLYSGMTGRKLVKLGLSADIDACAAADSFATVPRLHGTIIV